MMVPLPLGEPDAVRRLDTIAAETAARKHKARPDVGTGIFRFIAGQRLWYRAFPRQRAVNLVVTSAVLRIVYAIPNVVVLALLTWVGAIVWTIAMVHVFLTGSYPESWWHFMRGIVAWDARLMAYLASLVDQYPPFSLEPGTPSRTVPSNR